eukprot:CAMPEP_0172519606 /NCGR_PEP_ID=MMETSP1066-20121228/291514_1 /TAXON_ID=671091 /ORGANISM="Coscinodiscus wailesii, Strain CCMP2513" /LENGTH=578 /DNA_ID=CAMNT_0013302225 /DNA_START=51 /DNA_END=1786 /DNA_ORIENTATION=+
MSSNARSYNAVTVGLVSFGLSVAVVYLSSKVKTRKNDNKVCDGATTTIYSRCIRRGSGKTASSKNVMGSESRKTSCKEFPQAPLSKNDEIRRSDNDMVYSPAEKLQSEINGNLDDKVVGINIEANAAGGSSPDLEKCASQQGILEDSSPQEVDRITSKRILEPSPGDYDDEGIEITVLNSKNESIVQVLDTPTTPETQKESSHDTLAETTFEDITLRNKATSPPPETQKESSHDTLAETTFEDITLRNKATSEDDLSKSPDEGKEHDYEESNAPVLTPQEKAPFDGSLPKSTDDPVKQSIEEEKCEHEENKAPAPEAQVTTPSTETEGDISEINSSVPETELRNKATSEDDLSKSPSEEKERDHKENNAPVLTLQERASFDGSLPKSIDDPVENSIEEEKWEHEENKALAPKSQVTTPSTETEDESETNPSVRVEDPKNDNGNATLTELTPSTTQDVKVMLSDISYDGSSSKSSDDPVHHENKEEQSDVVSHPLVDADNMTTNSSSHSVTMPLSPSKGKKTSRKAFSKIMKKAKKTIFRSAGKNGKRLALTGDTETLGTMSHDEHDGTLTQQFAKFAD